MNQLSFALNLDEERIVTLTQEGQALTGLSSTSESLPQQSETPLLLKAKAELLEYLARKRQSFSIPLAFQRPPFSKAVLLELQNCPYGSLISYQELALAAGSAKASRAVGRAMALNPLPIFIPCHRVVSKGQTLGASYSFGGLAVQSFLLNLEQSNERI